ncbi:MAG: hypothetical protein ACQEXX_01330 [Bacillota bacterium]
MDQHEIKIGECERCENENVEIIYSNTFQQWLCTDETMEGCYETLANNFFP